MATVCVCVSSLRGGEPLPWLDYMVVRMVCYREEGARAERDHDSRLSYALVSAVSLTCVACLGASSHILTRLHEVDEKERKTKAHFI